MPLEGNDHMLDFSFAFFHYRQYNYTCRELQHTKAVGDNDHMRVRVYLFKIENLQTELTSDELPARLQRS